VSPRRKRLRYRSSYGSTARRLWQRSPSAADVMAIAMLVMMRGAGRVRMRVRQRGVVVLAKKIAAVIVAIGRAHDSMDVVARRLVVIVDDARLVVELDEDYRREDAVVEGAMVVDRADPGEMSSVEMALHLGPANRVMAPPNAPSIDAEQCFEVARPFDGRPGASRLFGGRCRATCPRCCRAG